jgi:voltage-gated potassium channel Kch
MCVYLLIGLAWSYAFTLLHTFSPTSFEGIADATTAAHATAFQFIYYSFVTLTTLGYGEITPASPVAQTLAYLEAVTGQFYLTILVAALVGMLLSKRMTGGESRA